MTIQLTITIIAALACLLLIVLIWRSFASQREQRRLIGRVRASSERQGRDLVRLAQALDGTARQLGELSERQDRLRDTVDARIDALQRANESQLTEMRQTVTEKLDGRLNESFQTVNRQLAEVHRGLGQMRELAGAFSDLKKVLGGVKTRGVWGEAQLRALLEETLARGQYVENAAIPEGSQTRVEFALKLPAADGEALLPIDSKFPQEDYLRLMDAVESNDPVGMEQCGRALERALTEQARLISEKYIRPPQTADFAVMFLPVESLYAEAVRRDGLCERLQTRYRVLVAGPNTLTALLTSLRMGFRTVTLARRSDEVLRLLTEVRDELLRYDEAAREVRRRLEQTAEAMDVLEKRGRALGRKVKNIDAEADGRRETVS